MAITLVIEGDSLADVLSQLKAAASNLDKVEVDSRPYIAGDRWYEKFVQLPTEAVAAVDETAGLAPAAVAGASPPTPASPPAPAAQAPEELRTAIRGVLTPLMKGDKAADARALVKKYGAGVSAVPDDKLQDLLDEAKELAK